MLHIADTLSSLYFCFAYFDRRNTQRAKYFSDLLFWLCKQITRSVVTRVSEAFFSNGYTLSRLEHCRPCCIKENTIPMIKTIFFNEWCDVLSEISCRRLNYILSLSPCWPHRGQSCSVSLPRPNMLTRQWTPRLWDLLQTILGTCPMFGSICTIYDCLGLQVADRRQMLELCFPLGEWVFREQLALTHFISVFLFFHSATISSHTDAFMNLLSVASVWARQTWVT